MMKPRSNAEVVSDVCRYVEEHSDEALTLAELATLASMSRFHFARTFKTIVGLTPKQYLATVRLRKLKGGLERSKSVDTAALDAGYGSASRIYEMAASRLGMTPAQYRRGGEGVAISYAFAPTPFGLMTIGATDRGICFIGFGDEPQELLARLHAEYRNAHVVPMTQPYDPQFRIWIDSLVGYLAGDVPKLELPLDIRATAFEMRVWNYLAGIAPGEVRSYGEVASAIGRPAAARAVAQACARNPVAVLIPCHRVIRGSGDLGGYRWGVGRKRALIERERAQRARTQRA
jgi:AraC family transcriptional regulator, regulatory protein of adaptative response / methylated-DNA-[protein]-cysteine methyltransferase